MKKFLNPTAHILLDYLVAGSHFVMPKVMGMSREAMKTFQILGVSILTNASSTDNPIGLMKGMSFQTHQKTDLTMLASLPLLAFASSIKNDKKALRYHLFFIVLAFSHYFMTDFNKNEN